MSQTTRDRERKLPPTFFERLQKKFQLIPLKDLSTEKLESQGFVEKFVGTLEFFGVWGATYSEKSVKRSRAGLLDFAFLGIPRFLDFLADESETYFKENNFLGWTMFLVGRPLLRLLFFIQQTIGLVLTITATVTFLLPIVQLLYPTPEKSYLEISDKPSETGKKRRQWFFNPSFSVWMFLLLVGIGLWIQSALPTLFFESAAAPLLILQTVFVGIAGLMLVGGALYLAYSGIVRLIGNDKAGKILELDDKEQKSELEALAGEIGEIKLPPSSPGNGIVNYFRELWSWGQSRPNMAIPLAVIWGLCVTTALILVIGFFADPVTFSFMSNLFDFVGNGFWAGTKNASHLMGLKFLSSISDTALLAFSHIASASALLCAAIFGPDIFRLGLQYFFPKPDDQNQVKKITSNPEDNSESEYIKVTTDCNFEHELWNKQNPDYAFKAEFSFKIGDVIYLKDRGDGWCLDGGNNAIPFDLRAQPKSGFLQKPLGKYEPAIVVNKPLLQKATGQPQGFNPGDNATAEKKPWTPTHRASVGFRSSGFLSVAYDEELEFVSVVDIHEEKITGWTEGSLYEMRNKVGAVGRVAASSVVAINAPQNTNALLST